MTAPAEKTAPSLWKGDGFFTDDYQAVPTDHEGALPQNAIVPLPRIEEALAGSNADIAVEMAPGDDLEAILPHLDRIALVALVFPAFTDGRAYSLAALLRQRHGFEGEIRAVGDVLIDQIPHMLRQGFDSFSVKNPATQARLEEGGVQAVPHYYQPAIRPAKTTPRFAWRRLPA